MTQSTHLKTVLLAGAAMAIATPGLAQTTASADQTTLLDEVVVTANKRSENVREVAGSISAVTGQQLQAIGAESLADYIQRIPGVVFNSFQPGVSHVVMRGIATNSGNDQGQGTTGYFLNDIPLSEPGWTIVVPDIDTFDLSRVEVTRGPQGTLMGAASMGGAINYVTNTADPSGFDAAVEATVSQTHNADIGGAVKAMINVPISDTFAVRLSGGYRDTPGYIDNIGTGQEGANNIALSNGRLSVVWQPNDDTTVSVLSMFQKMQSDDNSYRQVSLGGLRKRTVSPETTDIDVELHSLRLDHDFGFASFTAIGAYQKKSQDWIIDFDHARSFYNSYLDLNLTNPLYIATGGSSTGKSLEMRLASPSNARFEWLIGAMYFDTDKDLYEQLGALGAAAQFDASSQFGPGSGAIISPDDHIFNAVYANVQGSEKALFGEASWRITPEWKLTAGGRLFRTSIDLAGATVGFSTYPGAPILTNAKTEEDGFSPKLSLTWEPNEDLMVYGLVSKGFRFGTPNIGGLSAFPVPAKSTSDELINYELGTRTTWLDRTLVLDATIFYVDWSDIQVRAYTPDFFAYATNGGTAVSKGVEFSGLWAPTPDLDLSTSITYTEASLTQRFAIVGGMVPRGTALPGSSPWSVTNTAVYRFGGAYSPTLTVSHSYLSEGLSDLTSSLPGGTPTVQGDYNLFDLRLRFDVASTRISVFGTNLTDERGVTRGVMEAVGLLQGVVRPRTLGVTMNWAF